MYEGSISEEIKIKGEKINLLIEKALYFPERKILVLADLHFGKANHFRKNGIYVPFFKELILLDQLTKLLNPEVIIFLGDLFHSVENESVSYFREWSGSHQRKMILVQGNHDILPCKLYVSLGLECLPEYKIGELLLLHDRDVNRSEFTVYGHIHPAVTILGKGRQGVNLPAFVLNPDSLLLPAFGNFTGTMVIPKNGSNIFYALTEKKIFLIR